MVDKIKRSACLKSLIVTVILTFLVLCGLCSFFFCTQPVIHPVSIRFPNLSTIDYHLQHVIDKLKDMYGITDMNSVGYIIVRFQDNEGHAEMAGILGASTHYIIIVASTLSVFYFSYAIWKGIKALQNQMKDVDVKLEKQLFKVLMIQVRSPPGKEGATVIPQALIRNETPYFSDHSTDCNVPHAVSLKSHISAMERRCRPRPLDTILLRLHNPSKVYRPRHRYALYWRLQKGDSTSLP